MAFYGELYLFHCSTKLAVLILNYGTHVDCNKLITVIQIASQFAVRFHENHMKTPHSILDSSNKQY
jgi:hypothetical protein